MTGKRNVHILVIGSSNDDVTRIAHELDNMGYIVGGVQIRIERRGGAFSK
jgi:hypothetical protein